MIRMSGAFVILKHSRFGPTHYDFMLESGDALSTWRLSSIPANLKIDEHMPAVRLADHRRAYLEYEGQLSGGRGEVRTADRGEYRTLRRTTDAWEVALAGESTRGRFALRRNPAGAQDWTLTRLGGESD